MGGDSNTPSLFLLKLIRKTYAPVKELDTTKVEKLNPKAIL